MSKFGVRPVVRPGLPASSGSTLRQDVGLRHVDAVLEDGAVDVTEVGRAARPADCVYTVLPSSSSAVVDVRDDAVDAADDRAADDEHRTLRSVVRAVVVLRDAPAELAPDHDADTVDDRARIERSPCREVVVEDLERVADLRVQPVVLAVVGVGAALIGVRVVAAVAQLEEACIDVRQAPARRRR